MRSRLVRDAAAIVLSAVVATNGPANAEPATALPSSSDCAVDAPDAVQISWDAPCRTGTWLMDTELGCRLWDWHPAPDDRATWSGACAAGVKSGPGVVQWYEHGQPIDRFEGTFVAGRREGYGRYVWNESDWFLGFYKDDLPDGPGTAVIAGEALYGMWHRGCFMRNGKVVAINVNRASCDSQFQSAAAVKSGRTE
jgi:hypothetical protein